MASKLAQLKKNRGENLKTLQKKLEESTQGGGGPRDERIWKPKFNKEKGKGTAIVRFLTPQEGEPFVEVKSYSFTGPGGNYFDTALQTIGEKDPIQLAAISAFRKAKADGDERLRDKAKRWIPKSQFFANVMVIKDEENPENEGQVKIFQFGKQIYGFIEKAIQPEFDDEDPMDPFDFWSGADFKIRMVGKEIPDSRTGNKTLVPNYENSEFARGSEFLDGDEDKIEEQFVKTYDLSEFTKPEKFKSFEEVAKRFKDTMGHPYNWLSADATEEHIQEKQQQQELNQNQDNGESSDKQSPPTNDEDDEGKETNGGDEDDPVAKFRALANRNK